MGYSEIFAPPKKNYVGAPKNNTGGLLKIRGDWVKFKYEGHTKFLGEFEKNRGGKAFRGPVTEGCLNSSALCFVKFSQIACPESFSFFYC